MESTIAESTQPQVTVGVDTHKQFHVAHAVDGLGRPLGSYRLAASSGGYAEFVAWAHSLGQLTRVGIEGPGHFGAGLARHLVAEGITVSEVSRPSRQHRARYGKSDDADAAGAAAAVLAGDALGEPKLLTAPRRWCGYCGWRAPAWCGPAPRPTPPCRACL